MMINLSLHHHQEIRFEVDGKFLAQLNGHVIGFYRAGTVGSSWTGLCSALRNAGGGIHCEVQTYEESFAGLMMFLFTLGVISTGSGTISADL